MLLCQQQQLIFPCCSAGAMVKSLLRHYFEEHLSSEAENVDPLSYWHAAGHRDLNNTAGNRGANEISRKFSQHSEKAPARTAHQ